MTCVEVFMLEIEMYIEMISIVNQYYHGLQTTTYVVVCHLYVNWLVIDRIE